MLRYNFPLKITSPFPTLVKLHEYTTTSMSTSLFDDDTNIDSSPPLSSSFYVSTLRSDGLFFIRYTTEDKLKSRWSLVQIHHDETLALKMKPEKTDNYHVTFYHVTLWTITCMMTMHIDGQYGINMS